MAISLKRKNTKTVFARLPILKIGRKVGKGALNCVFPTLSHWFYFGDWKAFDQLGNISEIDYYEECQLSSTLEVGKR